MCRERKPRAQNRVLGPFLSLFFSLSLSLSLSFPLLLSVCLCLSFSLFLSLPIPTSKDIVKRARNVVSRNTGNHAFLTDRPPIAARVLTPVRLLPSPSVTCVPRVRSYNSPVQPSVGPRRSFRQRIPYEPVVSECRTRHRVRPATRKSEHSFASLSLLLLFLMLLLSSC